MSEKWKLDAISIRHRLVVGLAWMFAGSWSEQGLNFTFFVVLARMLGAEVFGLAAMAIVFVLFAEFLVRETMTETIIQLDAVEDGHLDAVFWMLGAFSLLIVALVIALSDRIAGFFSEPQIARYMIWATPTVLFIGFSGVPVASLRRKLEFRILAIRATVGVLAGGMVGISMAIMDLGVWSLIAQRVTQVFVNNALAWIAHPWRPGLRARRRHFRDVFGFSTRMVSLRASELVAINAPTVVIGSYLGPVALGQFTIAWRIVGILSFVLTTPIRFVAQPAFAHLHRSEERAGPLLQDVMNASSLVTFVSFLGMAAIASPAIQYIFGDAWISAVPILQVLCLLGIYLSIESMQQAFCIALGRAGWLVLLSSTEAALGTGSMIYMVERGPVGICVAFTTIFFIVWPLRILLVTRLANLRILEYLSVFVLPLALSVVTFVAVESWLQLLAQYISTLPLLVSSILIGLVVYVGSGWLTIPDRFQQVISSMQMSRKVTNSENHQ